MAQQTLVGHKPLIIEASRSRSDTPHSSGRVISPTQRNLPDNTRHSQQTDIHVPGGIRTRNPSKRTAADPHFRPRGHWDRQMWWYVRTALRECMFRILRKAIIRQRKKIHTETLFMHCQLEWHCFMHLRYHLHRKQALYQQALDEAHRRAMSDEMYNILR
jgi:hypothetical protein